VPAHRLIDTVAPAPMRTRHPPNLHGERRRSSTIRLVGGPAIPAFVQRALDRYLDVSFTVVSELEGPDGRVAPRPTATGVPSRWRAATCSG
jgi:hypothetical protein